MKNAFLFSVLYSFLFSSCGLIASFKIQDAFEAETISRKSFKEELSFQEVNGLIIIQAEFEGVLKNFIFDTGATTKLDKKFASTLKVQKLGKVKTFDSNNNKKKIQYVKLENFKIGDISFYDIVASVSDIEPLNTAACIDVVGIIGANAMNKCIWQIDYQKQRITFTNDRDSLTLPGKEKKINFSAMGKGVPTISLYADGNYWGETIFDTGSNGNLAINDQYLLNSLDFVEKQVYNFGVFSSKIRSKKLATVPIIQLNKTLSFNNQLITFEKNLPYGIIGNKFLKDYIVTIDWMYQHIFLERKEPEVTNPYKDFGCSLRFVEGAVIIGSIRLNSAAYKKGLRLNDRVLKTNDIAFTEDAHENYCKYLNHRNNWKSLNLIAQKNNKELTVLLEKSNTVE